MKKTIIILALAAALLPGCSTAKHNLDQQRAYISWVAFCANRGYHIDSNTYDVTNEYLDTWCGSVDEEAAFIAAGVEPY